MVKIKKILMEFTMIKGHLIEVLSGFMWLVC